MSDIKHANLISNEYPPHLYRLPRSLRPGPHRRRGGARPHPVPSGGSFFDHVILFDTPNTRENTRLTRAALEGDIQASASRSEIVPLTDPTDYLEILSWLRRHFQEIPSPITRPVISSRWPPAPPDARLLAAAGGQWGTAGHAAQYPAAQVRHRGPAPPGGSRPDPARLAGGPQFPGRPGDSGPAAAGPGDGHPAERHCRRSSQHP